MNRGGSGLGITCY